MSTNRFTTKKLVTLAILSALGTGLMWLEIPFIPPFKLDPSDSAVIVAAVLYGPIGAAVVAAIKGLGHFIFLSSGDFGIGEMIAFVASMAYALPFYFSLKAIRRFTSSPVLIRVLPTVVGTIALTIILPLLNYLIFVQIWSYVMFNQFMAHGDVVAFAWGTVPGNLIKGIGLSIIFIILSIRLDYIQEKLHLCEDDVCSILLPE